MKTKIMNVNLKPATVFVACLIVFLFSCEKRRDFLKDQEMAAAKPPKISIRRVNSLNPYQQTFSDTSLIGVQGYKLQYQITGNYDASTIKLSCVTKCDSIVNVVAHPDSNYFAIFTKPLSTVSWHLTVSNKYNQTASAFFNLFFQNARPRVNIRKTGLNNIYAKLLHDSCFYALTSSYNIGFSYSDDNSNYTNLTVEKATVADNSIITVSNGNININYGLANQNKKYVYKIYGVDPLNAASDTCYAYISYYNKIPLLYIVNQQGNNIYTLNDSLKTIGSTTYSLAIKIVDETATISNLTLTKLTSGDNSVITKTSNHINFNYTGSTINKLYQYKMYVKDPQGLASDTCYFKVYIFKNRPPVYITFNANNASATSSYITPSKAPYLTNDPDLITYSGAYQVWKLTGIAHCYDPDGYNYGGYVTKVKYYIQLRHSCGRNNLFSSVLYINNTTQQLPIYNSNFLFYYTSCPGFESPTTFGTNTADFYMTIYDNDGDSTVVSKQVIQF